MHCMWSCLKHQFVIPINSTTRNPTVQYLFLWQLAANSSCSFTMPSTLVVSSIINQLISSSQMVGNDHWRHWLVLTPPVSSRNTTSMTSWSFVASHRFYFKVLTARHEGRGWATASCIVSTKFAEHSVCFVHEPWKVFQPCPYKFSFWWSLRCVASRIIDSSLWSKSCRCLRWFRWF